VPLPREQSLPDRAPGPGSVRPRDDPSPGFHLCPTCSSVVCWRALRPEADGRRRIALNVRLAEPEAVAHLPIDHLDGLNRFEDLPRDGHTLHDMWF
jgi:hypothetical protein